MPAIANDDFVAAMMVPTLYHYCSMETALKILESHTMRLSSVDHMNDPNECRYFQRLAIKHLHEIPSLSDAQRDAIREYFSSEYLENLDHLTAETFANAYCFCMSIDGDDLSQWRGYGDDGYGVAIGFRKDGFRELQASDSAIRLAYVRYSEEELLEYLRSLEPLQFKADGTDLTPMFASLNFRTVAPVFKHHAFKAEREWRLIYSPAGYPMGAAKGQVDGLSFKTIMRGKTAVPCYDMRFKPSIIADVRLGPKVSKLSTLSLRLMLDAHDFQGVEIKQSSIAYR